MCCFLAALAGEHISIAGHSAAMEKSFFSALSVRSVRNISELCEIIAVCSVRLKVVSPRHDPPEADKSSGPTKGGTNGVNLDR